ncbi:MAG: hypothetical protein ACRDGL_10910 [Candidatus Limnocylindrales bacterium]
MISPPSGTDALILDDAGRRVEPSGPEDWQPWVAASRTRHFLDQDPLLDWLDRFGEERGFVKDTDLDGYDPRTDLRTLILERGKEFEDGVVGLIKGGLETVRIGEGWQDARDLAAAARTVAAMQEGAPVIAQAVLRDPSRLTYGTVDLLVRSDLLNEIVPEALDPEEARVGAPGIGAGGWHYRAIDIKFRTLQLLKDGAAGGDLLAYMAQVWVYDAALGRIQGYTPPAAFLLGRSWTQGKERGEGCFERLARVDHDRTFSDQGTLEEQVLEGLAWVRRVRQEGPAWNVLPEPSVAELYPHMRHQLDAPWHTAKATIAAKLGELTLLPAMNPQRRAGAHRRGIKRWEDARATAETLGVTTPGHAAKCEAVLAANRPGGTALVLPERLAAADPAWRAPAPLELYVDFETVSNINDDFSQLPRVGGQTLIFQIGCGHWGEDGGWIFEQWTVERLREPDEAAAIGAWVAELERLRAQRGLTWDQVRIVHWSPAETSTLVTAYNSAAQRHPEADWPELPWFDALGQVARPGPLTVRGAFNFGLKSIAKAMHSLGLIETSWGDGPTDGLGAMVGAWWCDGEAARRGGNLIEIDLMRQIAAYNEVDCRTMAEVLRWLRANR